MVSTNLQATHAGVCSSSGAPFGPFSKGSPPIVLPSRSWDLKKLKAIPCWPLPRMLRANSPVSLIMACAPESVFTPKTTRGGAKAAWVTQFTVAAATAPFLPSAVRTYSPYGIIRKAVFLASSFTAPSSLYSSAYSSAKLCGHVDLQRHDLLHLQTPRQRCSERCLSSGVVYTTARSDVKAVEVRLWHCPLGGCPRI